MVLLLRINLNFLVRFLLYLIVFFLFLNELFSQIQEGDTFNVQEKIVKSEGDWLTIKSKSSITGLKMKIKLKKGPWKYFNENGDLILEENYKVNKKYKVEELHGIQIFYEPFTQDTLFIINYKKGQRINMYPQKSSIILYKNEIFNVEQTENEEIVVEVNGINKSTIRPDFDMVAHYQNNVFQQLLKSGYKNFEAKHGDGSLLQSATFDVFHQGNLILNPEMENSNFEKSIISMSDKTINFWQVASISPDFYVNDKMAKSGSKFLGFRVFSMTNDIEYLQVNLDSPLEKDSIYCFSAHLKLSGESRYASNAFGVKFIKDYTFFSTDEVLNQKADIELGNKILLYKTKWMNLQTTFTAKGDERYAVIGSFKDHRRIKVYEVPGSKRESYYFMDDVSLVKVSHPRECPDRFSDTVSWIKPKQVEKQEVFKDLKVGDIITLENINFEHDKDILQPSSLETLTNLVALFQRHPSMIIELRGHTSSLGKKEYNLKLSQKRADAVMEYLIHQGIASNQLSAKGFGDELLVADDATEEGQLINRRVEFRVVSL
jgi:outer membrane protein OmpA-like peptidoglycan-associated protein